MLHSTFQLLFNKRFDCETQRARHGTLSEEESTKRLAIMEQDRGCKGNVTRRVITRIQHYELRTCPCNFQNPRLFSEHWKLFDAFDRLGALPYSGGFAQQPSKLLDIFTVLRGLKSDYETEQLKAAQKKGKKNGRGV